MASFSTRTVLALLFSVVGSGIAGCAAHDEVEVAAGPADEIIGGVDAASVKLDAIGSLVFDGKSFCTGTLIAPTLVLTAKHCALQLDDGTVGRNYLLTDVGSVSFAIGHDSTAPRRAVTVKRTDMASLNVGGIGYGADVAVYTLDEAITEVDPLPVSPAFLTEADVGKAFVAIGYGVRDRAGSSGRRTMGNITLSMLEGLPYEAAFGDYESFAAYYAAALGRTLSWQEEEEVRAIYSQPLLSGYEVFFGAKDGDAQACSGDSGGPLLRKVDGKLTVFGVASWVPSKSERSPCSRGAIYATFGPSVRELFAEMSHDACGDVPVAGQCDGNTAVRCISSEEGTPRVTRTNCEDLDQACAIVDGRAACVDP